MWSDHRGYWCRFFHDKNSYILQFELRRSQMFSQVTLLNANYVKPYVLSVLGFFSCFFYVLLIAWNVNNRTSEYQFRNQPLFVCPLRVSETTPTNNWYQYLKRGIFITHLIVIIKSEVSIFPIVVTFSMVVHLRLLCHYMLLVSYIPGKMGCVSFITV